MKIHTENIIPNENIQIPGVLFLLKIYTYQGMIPNKDYGYISGILNEMKFE